MKSSSIDEEMLESVVQHMNEDHNDACLVIAQTLGGKPTAMSALMTGMDAHGIDLQALMQDGTQELTRVAFDKPVSRDSQIRGHIVALTRSARAISEQ